MAELTVTDRDGLELAVAVAIARSSGMVDAGEHVLGAIGRRLDLRAGVLWRLDERREHLIAAATWAAGLGAEGFIEESRRCAFAIGTGLPGMVWEKRHVVWLPDVWSDERYPRAAAARGAGLRTSIGIPLIARGELVGVAELLASVLLTPDEELSRVLDGLGGQIGQLLQRVQADEAIAASEARKAAILDAALDIVITADLSGRIVEVNHALTSLLGWQIDDAVGARIGDLIVPPELRDAHEAGLARYAETGEGRIIGRRVEIEALHREGHRVPVELTLTRVDAASPALVTAFVRDLTERRRIEDERSTLLEAERAARASAEQAWQQLRLVSDVSELLAASLDSPEAFGRLAGRIVADMADLCLIDTIDARGRVVRVAARHRDGRMQVLSDRLVREFAPDPDGMHPAAGVLRTARSRFGPFMSEEFLRATCRNEEHYQLVRELGFESYLTVPLIARSKILGALTLISTNPKRRYGVADLAVAEEIGRRAAVRIDNARLYRERDHVARVLQQGLLPRRLPTIPRLEIEARYVPAGDGIEAGGDFYDVFATGPGQWGLALGDVCGKGPEAAARMGLARPALRALAHAYRRPARLLQALNDELLGHDADLQFLTVVYVQVRIGVGDGVELTACLAGHAPALLRARSGHVRDLGRPGTLLGVSPRITLSEQRTRLLPGETLLLYTDGLADEGRSRTPATPAQLRQIVAADGVSTGRLVKRLEGLLDAVPAGATGWRDDVAFMVVRCL